MRRYTNWTILAKCQYKTQWYDIVIQKNKPYKYIIKHEIV